MDPIIRVSHVDMKFHMNMTRTNSLKEWFVQKARGKLRYENFYALKDVSLEVERGEVVGIVGQNGSGKSTLLKVISGIYKPSAGEVVSAGRIAPMLELGSGFDYELSGEENVFLNGAILGFEESFLKAKYQEILEFSELGDFIHQPIKTYSSGMVMRLAFSVATLIEPEILIVDEILAVGDQHFQKKSLDRMMQLMSSGTTVLLVSHSIEQIRQLSTHCIWLDHGHVMMDGPTKDVCDAYDTYMNT